MDRHRFQVLKARVIAGASAKQILDLEATVRLIISQRTTEIALGRRTNVTIEKRICPSCRSHNVVLHGLDSNRRQRFKCRDCRRTYNILTGTSMARARKPEKWATYLGFMTDHTSVRKIVAAGIGIHHVTVWRWRQRFLRAIANDHAPALVGIVEAGTTSIPQSFKGCRNGSASISAAKTIACIHERQNANSSAPRRRVSVLTAIDSSDRIYQQMMQTFRIAERPLANRIAAGSMLCSDGAAAYLRIAAMAGVEHRQAIMPTRPLAAVPQRSSALASPRIGQYGLGRVTDHHHTLKVLVTGRCRGVATKYLANYLGWHRAMRRKSFEGKQLLDHALLQPTRE